MIINNSPALKTSPIHWFPLVKLRNLYCRVTLPFSKEKKVFTEFLICLFVLSLLFDYYCRIIYTEFWAMAICKNQNVHLFVFILTWICDMFDREKKTLLVENVAFDRILVTWHMITSNTLYFIPFYFILLYVCLFGTSANTRFYLQSISINAILLEHVNEIWIYRLWLYFNEPQCILLSQLSKRII